MIEQTALINRLYALFNARKLDEILEMLTPDVVWANGMEGGHVHGRDGIRDYWGRQWAMIDPSVEPTRITVLPSGPVVVDVRQVVRDLAGKTLSDETVRHSFIIRDGRVARFDILGRE
jgi:hypothetical protein